MIIGVVFLVEIIGGIVFQSLSLQADAWHMLGDGIATAVSLVIAYAVYKGIGSALRARKRGAKLHGILLALASVWILKESIERASQKEFLLDPSMLSVAVLGTIGNIAQLRLLSRFKNETQYGLRAHARSDLFCSIAVIFVGVTVFLTGIRWIDIPVAGLISIWMMHQAYLLFSHKGEHAHEH